MSSFQSPPGGSPRDRNVSGPGSLGFTAQSTVAKRSLILPETDRGVLQAQRLENALGIAAHGAARVLGAIAEDRKKEETAEERRVREDVFGYFNAGDPEGGQARINELIAEGALTQEQGFRFGQIAEQQLARQEAELEKQRSEIDQEHRGLGADRADVFLQTELQAIARGESTLPDGADVPQGVEDALDDFLEGQPEAFAESFKRRVRPQLVKAHLQFADKMRAGAVDEGLTLRASALHSAQGPDEQAEILEGVRNLASRTPDILTPDEAVGRVALRAAEFAAEIDGDLGKVNDLAALAGGGAGERFGLEFDELREKARTRRLQLDAQRNGQARDALQQMRLNGASLEHINATARGMAARGEIDPAVANQVHGELHDQRKRSLDEARKQAEAASQERARASITQLFRGQMVSPDGPGLSALVADPDLRAAVEEAGLPADTIPKARERAIHEAIVNVEADESLTTQQKRSRQLASLNTNGVVYEPWSAQMMQGLRASASTDLIEGVAVPRATIDGYKLWESIRAESPEAAVSHSGNAETRRFYEMVDLARRHAFPSDPEAGIDTTEQAIRLVNRQIRSMVPASIQSDAKQLKRSTSWIDDAYNAPELQNEVRRLAELYLGAGVAPDAKAALEAASDNVKASVQRIGDHYVYARDLRLPDKTAQVATGIIDGFAAKYGSMLGLNRRQIALMPDPDGSGLWQLFDTSGGIAVPIQTSLPGGAGFRPGATSFTPDELSAIAAGMMPPPDYAAEAVGKWTTKQTPSWWENLIAPLGDSPSLGMQ